MFDKDLFLSLCEKYDVELSETVDEPMIKDGIDVHMITNSDIKRIFASCQMYFDYSGNITRAGDASPEFYSNENYAVAC